MQQGANLQTAETTETAERTETAETATTAKATASATATTSTSGSTQDLVLVLVLVLVGAGGRVFLVEAKIPVNIQAKSDCIQGNHNQAPFTRHAGKAGKLVAIRVTV